MYASHFCYPDAELFNYPCWIASRSHMPPISNEFKYFWILILFFGVFTSPPNLVSSAFRIRIFQNSFQNITGNPVGSFTEMQVKKWFYPQDLVFITFALRFIYHFVLELDILKSLLFSLPEIYSLPYFHLLPYTNMPLSRHDSRMRHLIRILHTL